jgi:L-ascorbate metabolism protein UlaG (beta-lactamase superfamily)
VHITFLGHAQLLVRVGTHHLFLDPWFAEPVFAHSWWHYPPRPYPTIASLPPIDALLLSHIHPDHSGPATLAQIDRHTPTWALDFPSRALYRRLARAGYDRVTWPAAYETREILPGVRVTFVPHDRGWEVASIVLEAGGTRLYHGNDNALSREAYAQVVARLGPIDVAFLPFSGASSYPTGFDFDPRALAEKAAAKKAEGLARFTDGLAGLRPRVAVPFASSFALLEPDQLWKNYADRPTPAEALAAAHSLVGTEVLPLDPGDEWSPAAGRIAKGLAARHSYDRAGIERYAAQMAERVGAMRAAREAAVGALGAHALDRAVRRYFSAMLEATAKQTTGLDMVAGFVAEGAGAWHLVFEPGRAPEVRSGACPEADETFTVTASEMTQIVAGPLNWEDPWYGYRLRVSKRPGAGYYRAFWEMLLNFDDEALSERMAAESAARGD